MEKLLLSAILACFVFAVHASAQTIFRIVSLNSTNPNMILSDTTTGAVANLGASPAISPALSESDARFWGVAEFDGATIILQSFTNLGDIKQFSVSLSRNRWYYHSERGTQFGGTDLEEAIGYLNATFNFASGSNTPPIVAVPLADASVNEDAATPTAVSTALGYYRFADVAAGDTYFFTVRGNRFEFASPTQAVNVSEDTNEVNFVALPGSQDESRRLAFGNKDDGIFTRT